MVFESRETLPPEFPRAQVPTFDSIGEVEVDAFDVVREQRGSRAYPELKKLLEREG